jgi:hypothetical protein
LIAILEEIDAAYKEELDVDTHDKGLHDDPKSLEVLADHAEKTSGFKWEKDETTTSYLASKILRELEELKKEVEELKKEKGKDDQ